MPNRPWSAVTPTVVHSTRRPVAIPGSVGANRLFGWLLQFFGGVDEVDSV